MSPWTPAFAGVTAVILFLLSLPLHAADPCIPNETQDIAAEARCAPKGGISIGLSEEEGAKVACMTSKKVRNQCGPDGALTRLKAYQLWIKKVHAYEEACTRSGGTFSFKEVNFVEPRDDSYCYQSTPEVTINMFEEPVCNYRSSCPPVTVACERRCAE